MVSHFSIAIIGNVVQLFDQDETDKSNINLFSSSISDTFQHLKIPPNYCWVAWQRLPPPPPLLYTNHRCFPRLLLFPVTAFYHHHLYHHHHHNLLLLLLPLLHLLFPIFFQHSSNLHHPNFFFSGR